MGEKEPSLSAAFDCHSIPARSSWTNQTGTPLLNITKYTLSKSDHPPQKRRKPKTSRQQMGEGNKFHEPPSSLSTLPPHNPTVSWTTPECGWFGALLPPTKKQAEKTDKRSN
eukprot:Hpha_TRINITY_DN15435_c0_g2::TRINITY_DN15435_c0_g2_i1::g.177265::m.177265